MRYRPRRKAGGAQRVGRGSIGVVEYTAMRTLEIVVAVAITATGCATAVVLENPATKARVNCTVEAQRLAEEAPNPSTGTDVPYVQRGSSTMSALDLEQQCVGTRLREGFVCVSGCATPPR